MTTLETRDLYNRAIERYGVGAQVMKAIEEFAELTQALCKASAAEGQAPERVAEIADNLSEEMADALIMWEQLLLIFGNSEDVSDWLGRKKERLEARLWREAMEARPDRETARGAERGRRNG